MGKRIPIASVRSYQRLNIYFACAYRVIVETVYVYHIAHGASNYPGLFKKLLKEENTTR